MTVYSDRHRMVFVHIPKCAGTTIMRGLKPLNTFEPDAPRPYAHPELGLINLDHLTLSFLRRHFPEQLEKIAAYDSYAIFREPQARFSSAVLQYLRSYHKARVSRQSRDDVLRMARWLCGQLGSADGSGKPEFTIFQRQADFIRLEGRRIVRHLYPIEDVPRLADDLRRRHGIPLDLGRKHNEMRLADGRAVRTLRKLIFPLFSRLPQAGQNHLRRLSHTLLNNSPEPIYRALAEDRVVRAFVARHYAEDDELYRSVASKAVQSA